MGPPRTLARTDMHPSVDAPVGTCWYITGHPVMSVEYMDESCGPIGTGDLIIRSEEDSVVLADRWRRVADGYVIDYCDMTGRVLVAWREER